MRKVSELLEILYKNIDHCNYTGLKLLSRNLYSTYNLMTYREYKFINNELDKCFKRCNIIDEWYFKNVYDEGIEGRKWLKEQIEYYKNINN